jgi:hypothetical protein
LLFKEIDNNRISYKELTVQIMANETITDDIVRDFFKENKIYKNDKIIIERQSTKKLANLLKIFQKAV